MVVVERREEDGDGVRVVIGGWWWCWVVREGMHVVRGLGWLPAMVGSGEKERE